MNILVTNDDGIESGAMWTLVAGLKKVARVTVVAPDRERSAIGTAVTLFEPLHADEVKSRFPDVTAYAVDGSPSDCVVLALGRLIQNKVDLVVSGINPNLNLGEDVHISGTVGGALQGYFRGLPALAVSAPPGSPTGTLAAARVSALIAAKIGDAVPARIFLNINVPDLPLQEVAGVRITRLARASHINTVEEEENGHRRQYQLIRSRLSDTADPDSDIYAIENGYISLTPLYTSLLDKPPQRFLKKLSTELLSDVRG